MQRAGAGPLGSDVALGFLAALLWSTATMFRLGSVSPATFVATFGCAAAGACPVVVLGRRVVRVDSPFRHWVAASILAVGPLALVGTVLKSKTHHRPLGGVTFAVVSTVVFVAALVASRRLLDAGTDGSRERRFARGALTVGGALSLLVVSKAVSAGLGADATPFAHDVVTDAVLGAFFVGLAVAAPAPDVSRRAGWFAVGAWVFAAAFGAAIVAENPAIRAGLAERAPLTLGIMGAPDAD